MKPPETHTIRIICPTSLQGWESSIDVALSMAGYHVDIPHRDAQDTHDAALLLYVGALADPELTRLNAAAAQTNRRILVITPSHETVRVGPLVSFGQTPCVTCYRQNAEVLRHNGYHIIADNTFIGADIQQLLPSLTSAIAAIVNEQAHPLFNGSTAIYDRAGTLLKQVRAARAGGCTTCSKWSRYPTESHLSAYNSTGQ